MMINVARFNIQAMMVQFFQGDLCYQEAPKMTRNKMFIFTSVTVKHTLGFFSFSVVFLNILLHTQPF